MKKIMVELQFQPTSFMISSWIWLLMKSKSKCKCTFIPCQLVLKQYLKRNAVLAREKLFQKASGEHSVSTTSRAKTVAYRQHHMTCLNFLSRTSSRCLPLHLQKTASSKPHLHLHYKTGPLSKMAILAALSCFLSTIRYHSFLWSASTWISKKWGEYG